MRPNRQMFVLLLVGVLGIAVAAAVTWGTSQLVSQRIGLASEPLTAGRSLLPAVIRRTNTATAPRPSTPTATTTTATTAPAGTPQAPPTSTSTNTGAATQTSPGATGADREGAGTGSGDSGQRAHGDD